MSILVRRIARAKWGDLPHDSSDVPADAITTCLKTSDNALSVWEIESEDELNDAILALVTGKSQEQFSKIDYVWIEDSKLKNKGLSLVDYPGDTAVDELVDKHKNIPNLTYVKLGKMKDVILECFASGKYDFKTRESIKKIVKSSIASGKLQREKLNEKLVKKENL